MFAEAIATLKLILDKDTRALVRNTRDAFQSLPDKLTTDSTSWRQHIRVFTERFKHHQEAEASAFISFVLATILREREQNAGTPTGKLFFDWWTVECNEYLRVVLSELIANAFQHALKHRRFGSVKISVMVSPWFVRVDVTDNGRGFSLPAVLSPQTDVQHGLQVVHRAATRLFTNSRGNRVTAVIDPSITQYHRVASLSYRDHEIIRIWLGRSEVSLHASDWTPLVQLIKRINRPRIIVDCTTFYWNTREFFGAREAVAAISLQANTRVAIVVSPTMLSLFAFETLSRENVRVFDCKYTYVDYDLGITEVAKDGVDDVGQTDDLDLSGLNPELEGFKEALEWLIQT